MLMAQRNSLPMKTILQASILNAEKSDSSDNKYCNAWTKLIQLAQTLYEVKKQ